MSLRWIEKTQVMAELKDDKSFQRFRDEAYRQFFSALCHGCGHMNARGASECTGCGSVLCGKIRGIVLAKEVIDILCSEAAKPVTSLEFTEYARLIEAGCNALTRLMDELRDIYAHDANGDKIEGEDGAWLQKDPLVIFPITAKREIAWGKNNRTEGFAVPEALPEPYVKTYKVRQALIGGQQQSLANQVQLLKQGRVEAPALIALLDNPDDTLDNGQPSLLPEA
jgi:hypothetical protein